AAALVGHGHDRDRQRLGIAADDVDLEATLLRGRRERQEEGEAGREPRAGGRQPTLDSGHTGLRRWGGKGDRMAVKALTRMNGGRTGAAAERPDRTGV